MAAHDPQVPAQVAPWEPTFTLDRQVARARREMGPARWAALNAEWNTPAKDARDV